MFRGLAYPRPSAYIRGPNPQATDSKQKLSGPTRLRNPTLSQSQRFARMLSVNISKRINILAGSRKKITARI
jgi:hypothetical protein